MEGEGGGAAPNREEGDSTTQNRRRRRKASTRKSPSNTPKLPPLSALSPSPVGWCGLFSSSSWQVLHQQK